MAFSLKAIIRAFAAPDCRLRCSSQLWRAIVSEFERRGKGRHEAGVFLLGVDDAGQKEVRQAVYHDDLAPPTPTTAASACCTAMPLRASGPFAARRT
jgi:hypothetical protein